MYSPNPPWFHLFKTLDHKWEHRSFNITDSARNSENIPSSGAWGIKSPSGLLRKLMKINVLILSCFPSALLPQLNGGFVWKTLIEVAVTDPLPPFQLQNVHCLCSRKGTCFVPVHTPVGTLSTLCINPEIKESYEQCNIYICIVFYKKFGPHTAFHQYRKSIKSIAHGKKWVRNRECEQVLNNSQSRLTREEMMIFKPTKALENYL